MQYVYNANGYQQKIVEARNPSVVYHTVNQTNAQGAVTSESLIGTQFQLSRTYNPKTGLPTNIFASSNYGVARTLLDIDLTFDVVGKLTSCTREVQASGSLPAKSLVETFGYDQLNRLMSSTATGHAAQTATSYGGYGSGYDTSGFLSISMMSIE